jgi:hypothetical protein
MAAIYYYDLPCGYQAKIKGSSLAAGHEDYDRYVNIYIKPEAEKQHKEECKKCA